MATKHPKHTPLPTMSGGDGGCLSVASFNLLAPAYVRPLDLRTGEVQPFAAFEWAEPAEEVLAWERRAPRLLAELRACGADVICLQELQLEREGGGGTAAAAAADDDDDDDDDSNDNHGSSRRVSRRGQRCRRRGGACSCG